MRCRWYARLLFRFTKVDVEIVMVCEFVNNWSSRYLDNILVLILYTFQIVKAYLRRGTAREMLGYYREAVDGLIFCFSLC